MNMRLPKGALDNLTPEQQTEVMKTFYEAAGRIGEASQQPMGLGAGIAIAGIAIGLGIAAYAFFKFAVPSGKLT